MRNLLHPFKPWALATLVTGSLVSSPALAEPVLWVSGDCPGDILVEVTEMDPYATVTVLYGEGASGDGLDIPRGPCEGVETELASADRGFDLTDDDGDGEVSLVSTVDGTRCGTAFHVLDIDSCQISNLSYIDEHDGGYDSEAYDVYSTPDYYDVYLDDTRPSWFTWDYDSGYADTLYDTYFIEFYEALYPGTYYDGYSCHGLFGTWTATCEIWSYDYYYEDDTPPVYSTTTDDTDTSTTALLWWTWTYDYYYEDDTRYGYDYWYATSDSSSLYPTSTYETYISWYYYDVYEVYYSDAPPTWLTWDYGSGYTDTLYEGYYTTIYEHVYAFWVTPPGYWIAGYAGPCGTAYSYSYDAYVYGGTVPGETIFYEDCYDSIYASSYSSTSDGDYDDYSYWYGGGPGTWTYDYYAGPGEGYDACAWYGDCSVYDYYPYGTYWHVYYGAT